LTLVQSTLCDMQQNITEQMHGLVQRMEVLEGARESASKQRDQEAATYANRLHHGQSGVPSLVEPLDTLAASMTDLEARFGLLRSDIDDQLATFSAVLEHLQKDLGGKAFMPTENDLHACVLKTSTHVARLEKLHEKWTKMQAVQGSSTEQQEVAESAAVHSQQKLPFQELGALPQSSQPSITAVHASTSSASTSSPGSASLHTSVSKRSAEQVPPRSGKGLGRGRTVRSLGGSIGGSLARRRGIVNSRIQHFEGRILEGKATLPQETASLDAHSPAPEHFQQPSPRSPRGEAQATSAAPTSEVQRPASHCRKTSESSGGSPYMQSLGASFCENMSETTDTRAPSSLDQDSLDFTLDVSSKTRSKEESQLCLPQPNPISVSFNLTANVAPPLFVHADRRTRSCGSITTSSKRYAHT